MHRYRVCCLILIALAAVAAPRDDGKRGVTPEDYYAFENIGDVRIAPDGKLVAYTVVTVDRKANRRVTTVWLTPADGRGTPRQFTTGPSSRSPRWSPDGQSIAFISTRTDITPASPASTTKPQVYVLSMHGGEARRITNLENGVDSFQWSPDGSRLACTSKVRDSNAPVNKSGSDVRDYLYPSYKFNDTGWYDDRRSHIFIADVKTGAARQITSGAQRNDIDAQWSPDGGRLAFVSENTDRPVLQSNNVWVIAAEGGTPMRVSDEYGTDRSPRWSPDGKRIAYVGALTASDQAKLRIAPASGGSKPVVAAPALDLAASELDWDRAGRAIYFTAANRGEAHLFRLDLASRKFAAVTSGPRALHHIDVSDGARTIAFAASDYKHLDDLYVADLDGQHERQLTHLNQALWGGLQLEDVERVSYKAEDGWDIDGFFMKPVGWQAGKKYPMVLSIHGGPAGMYGMEWFQEFQVYSARGWAVFFTNPRGSSGYGEKFQRGVELNWGGKAYTDIMKGVDVIEDKYSWIDRDRVGVTGGSYGGFMTNWIVGHTNRFKAAVTLRSISNFISIEGTRDAAYGHARDFGGDLFENFQLYWDSSPLKYAQDVKTPTLILHSDNDYRVPLEQGEQWFRALKLYGVTTELVIFPRENHNLTRSGEPKHIVESLNWQIYWFDRFLNGNESAVRPNER
ncbi:MAG: S9 family peptidase [Acidobacteriota bacterium]|nr:S9 family peptidase [Acidobacteriota bacterium]